MSKNSLALPDSLVQLLSAADARNGLPAGTMFSVMRQEIGGQNRFLQDPAAYHYEANAQGQRIAGHTGKVSTAFGPFGILESTARDPGFGVAPLKDKTIEEQVRFASDYLAARSKSAGGLKAGLAGYGEGAQYADQVLARNGRDAPVVIQNPGPVDNNHPPVELAGPAPEAVVMAQGPQGPITPAPMNPDQDTWQQFQRRFDRPTPEGMVYGAAVPAPAPAQGPRATPNTMSPEEVAELYNIPLGGQPNFGAFKGLARLGQGRKSA